ncbi:MAG: glucosamine-6-phosphate deaminase [Planctomycetota bacterium]
MPLTPIATPNFTPVELKALAGSPYAAAYPLHEKMPTLIVNNFPALGRLAAMRFIEWAQGNPGGAISLPTGKTPEHFIAWVTRILKTWNSSEMGLILEQNGVSVSRGKPDMGSLKFVQIDEFYPMPAQQKNSFHYYVSKYYVDGFGLNREKCLLMDAGRIGLTETQKLEDVWLDGTCDLELRTRQARTALERVQKDALYRVDQWCQDFEEKVRQMGGIGFFLGGIGPDGHIGFNVRGSDHHSTTRLTQTNYETQAASASDLGGIEVARKRLVITIGLGTITFNPNATALIIAAGEAKAPIVSASIQHDASVIYPATSLRGLPNARFYLTQGAAKLLDARRLVGLANVQTVTDEIVEQALVDVSVRKQRRLLDLTMDDVKGDAFAEETLRKYGGSLSSAATKIHDRLVAKIEAGAACRKDTCFLHTEPHHDDVMLGYLPAVVRNIRDASNEHYFATLTSGFTAVTNDFARERFQRARLFLDTPHFAALEKEGHFTPKNPRARNRELWRYLDGVAANDPAMRHEAESCRDIRNILDAHDESNTAQVRAHLDELVTYLKSAYPGQKDTEMVQRLKGMFREWEAETLWGYFGWQTERVFHLRLGFYSGDIFTQEPTLERDVPPVVELLKKTTPHVVSVALDPEASGPDTHYKVMQATAAGLKMYAEETGRSDITVWGYRNVWFRYHPCEANLFVPVSLNMMSIMESSFHTTFASQTKASFPSYEHEGPFCELAQKIQVSQYAALRTCLGEAWFYEHPSPLIRAARGLVFLKEMKLDEFYTFCRELRQSAENK